MTGYKDDFQHKLKRGEELTEAEAAEHQAQIEHKRLGEEKLLRKLDELASQANAATAKRLGVMIG